MRSLSPIILFLGLTVSLFSQSPHGDDFKVSCAACHNTEGWEIPADAWHFEKDQKPQISKTTGMPLPMDTTHFNHFKTEFPLEGQHVAVDCRSCHETLVFAEANTTCISCHTDMHEQTVGSDCARCHSVENWLVDNITDLHFDNGFPLLGIHATASCSECHTSASALQFDRIGNDCINCHLDDFTAATNPDHVNGGFSTDCTECHNMDGDDWTSDDFNHDFFPLTKGHEINECAKCHTAGNFSNTPTDCVACHQTDYDESLHPNHQNANFPTDCATCHTTDLSWEPADYEQHDAEYFPIYSGSHQGEWSDCIDCHNNPSNYTEFTCITCHINPETDNAHDEVVGYVYDSPACLACHPSGGADDAFDHNQTNFPLTGAHISVNCIDCHIDGFVGTPTDCASCHTMDFDQTTNPNHINLGLSTDCATCHTTEPGWSPATFDIHDDFYALNGAHAVIATDCATCHNSDYNNTPNTCAGCHTEDYNQTSNPDHQIALFPTDCETCHTEMAWVPSTYDHDAFYPFTGAHNAVANDCVACHNGDYTNTPNTCAGCHTPDYNQSANPNHLVLNIPTDCESCHTTEPDWMPATFDIHNDYYALNGAHALIANDCATCHNGDYNNTPNTCFGCHTEDYNNTTNPNHVSAQFLTDCQTCHSESEWVPATFDHDGEHFPIYSGAHEGEWSECIDCHTNPSNYAEFSCTGCHTNPQTDDDHNGVNGYTYNSPACLACHPTGTSDITFDHNQTLFPLTGAHTTTDCIACHANGFEGTPMECAACHITEFNETTNPNHNGLGLTTDCISCHTTESGWSPASFDIHDDYYVLNGAHASISNDCATCHNGDYTNTANTCAGCHTPDYNQTSNPDHQAAQFPTDCETCHTEMTWTPSTFDHDAFYPFTGAHNAVANDCVACHNGDYNNTPNTCAGCHTPDYNQSANPNHLVLNIPTDCESCHTTEPDWMPATFDIHNDYYALNGAHALIANDCVTCHNGDYNNTPNTCFGCHAQDYNNTTNPNHVSAQFSTDCQSCHSESEWVPATFDHDGEHFPIYSGTHQGEWSECIDCHTNPSNYAEFTCITCHANPETNNEHTGVGGYIYESTACLACHPTGEAQGGFDHNQTNFPLTGAHISIDCIACHANGYVGTPTDCAACHTPDFNQTTNPNHGSLGILTDCESCHTTEPGWSPASFDIHDDYYVLNGAHASISNDCATCHNGDYINTPNTCAGCHTPDYNQTSNPDHQAAQFPTDCETCHTEMTWAPSTFDHDAFYPLTGAHNAVANDCVICHNGDYNNTPNTCAGCHTPDYNQSANPNHLVLNIPTDCESCHTTEPDWMPATFDIHNDYYALNGAHALIANDCATCHNGDYNNTPNTCFGCHTEDYNNTTNPNHVSAQFSTECQTCHTESEWVPANFDHDGQYFPIYSGTHQGEWSECIDCHTNPSNYSEFTCITCHANPETDNAHTGVGGYVYESTACLACHPTGEAQGGFDHNQTNFPLTGAHISIDCIACHANGYVGTPTDCAACHTPDFNQTTNPNHGSLGIPTDCESCHTTEPGWMPASFDIHDDYYVLNGAHASISNDCATCHNGDYTNTANTCAGCHTPDYNQTSNPDHQAAQFPTDCETCHTEMAWVPSTFDHDAFYPLTGAHNAVANDCAICHNGNYNNTPNTCAGCHTPDYNQSLNPNHLVLNIPTDCESCHTTEPDWMPATFDIHNDYYVLNGAHALIANDCATCHNGDYNNTPNTCFGCHAQDYNNTTNPNHVSTQFSTDCQSCHTESEWVPANFDHDGQYFPIYSGTHQGEWSECIDCHTNPSNYTEFSCTTCHTNPETNNVHTGVGGYVYESTACLACHPTGEAQGGFDHNQTNFPLTGAHISIDCIACHANGYVGTPTDCAACHTSDFNQTTNPNHGSLGIPTDCESCHTTEPDWMPATFDIHNDYYVLNGAHAAIANDCATCHNGDYNNTPNTCFGCHEGDYNQTTNPNHLVAQFPTTCEDCHTETAWIPSSFDHGAFYPLTGAHSAIANDCAICHNGNYNNTPNTCDGCHTPDYNQTTNPNHIALALPTDCESCHTTEPDWMPATFDIHNDYYVLNGAHAAIANDCTTCHNGDYNNTPNTCFGCHEGDYNQTTNPNHLVAQFPTTCEDCHTETAWIPSSFDHGAFYPLTGAHSAIANDCAICHNGNYNNTPNTCDGCHTPDYNQTTNPNHIALALPTDCESCHTTEPDWMPATFDIHNDYYVLNGAHAAIANDCATCHNGDYNNTPNTCFGCHEGDYNQTTNPNHLVAQFPTTCEDCHTETAWIPSSFDHGAFYPLTGAHSAIANDCAICHNGNYNNTPNTCDGCHTPDYNQTTNPNHIALALPTDCESCHTTEPDWMPATFDIHNDYYVLNGAHAAIANDCATCHNGDYNNTPNTCFGCHEGDYNQTTNPDHLAAQFPTTCEDCHTETAWIPSSFDHGAFYPLTGAHSAIANDCAICHNGNYNNTPNTCDGCHTPDYNQTTNPNHIALALPTDCESCHTTEPDWMPATFDIHNDYYVLNGAHAAIANDCATCHNGDYNNTPNTCFGCHEGDYNQTTNPNHLVAQFPTTCEDCHTETAWIPSSFDHGAFYPLTGAHSAIANDCAICHNGNYNNTPNTCDGCHTPDYNQTTNPNHIALALPTDCESCHTTEPDWMPATFDIHNDYYVLNGAHAAIANDCATCHNGDYNNTPNTCFGCHEGDYNQTTNPNHLVAQFPTTCEDCHTETAWIPSSFDHGAFYPLTGAHSAIANDCAICHNGNYNNTPNTCDGCHISDYNQSTNPSHIALALPTDCESCHTTEPGWMPATFDIHNNYYVLSGAHIPVANDCAICHNGNYNNTPNTCDGCHIPDYNQSTNPNHISLALPTDCESCHTTEPDWMPATFDIHNNYYVLNGAHAIIANDCAACHNGNYNNTPNTCFGCHEDDYNGANNPNHLTAGFPTTCEDCHTEDTWVPANFDHDGMYFPIYSGKHDGEWDLCVDCHTTPGNFTVFSCIDCHEHDDQQEVDGNHSGVSGYEYSSPACYACHPNGEKD